MNIIIPMAGKGSRFQDAGYVFPKPLIDVNGTTMIEVVIQNLKVSGEHTFIFVVQKEHFESYDLYNLLDRATGQKSEIVQIDGITEGAACTVLTALPYINNDEELIIANSDQFVDIDIDEFIEKARSNVWDGGIITFKARHPKWSYARVDDHNRVLEVAEKKLISENATVGIYYFKKGKDFVEAAKSMIKKNIRYNNEFYVCPVFNELILQDKEVYIHEITKDKMHGLGTPEDLNSFLDKLNKGAIKI